MLIKQSFIIGTLKNGLKSEFHELTLCCDSCEFIFKITENAKIQSIKDLEPDARRFCPECGAEVRE